VVSLDCVLAGAIRPLHHVTLLPSRSEYSFCPQLFRSLKKSSLALGLFPISSYSRKGFAPLMGEFARIFGGGEEYEE
jgi:hypothetical protein